MWREEVGVAVSLEGAPRNPRGLGRAGPGPVGMMALVLVQELTVGRRGVRPRAGAPGQGPQGGGRGAVLCEQTQDR